MKKYLVIGIAAAVLIGLAEFVRVAHTRGSEQPGTGQSSSEARAPFAIIPIGKRLLAPDISLTTSDGKQFVLSKAVQSGPVVLDFWASYCGPCQAGIPHLEAMYQKYASKGVQFYGVNNFDSPDDVKKAEASLHVTFPTLIDANSDASRAYGVSAIPMTLVIGRQRHLLAGCMGFDENMDTDLGSTLDRVATMNSDMEQTD